MEHVRRVTVTAFGVSSPVRWACWEYCCRLGRVHNVGIPLRFVKAGGSLLSKVCRWKDPLYATHCSPR